MKLKYTIALIFILLTIRLEAQEETTFNFSEPTRLADDVNSDYEESLPILSADGNTLYFVRMLHPKNLGGQYSGHDIWYVKKKPDGTWGEPKHDLFSLNNRGNNAILGFGEDGQLFLLNNYGNYRKPGISVAEQKEGIWTYPEKMELPKIKKDGFFYDAFINRKGTVAIVSMKGKHMVGDEDLFVSLKDTTTGKWSEFKSMGRPINTTGFEITPFLAEDGKTLYFSSNGRDGFGDADMYVSTRLDDSWTNWSEPVNLGATINSAGFDAGYFEHSNGAIFFASSRNGKLTDLYETRRVVPEKEEKEEEPVVENELPQDEALADVEPTAEDNSMAEPNDKNKEAIVVEDVYPLTISIYFAFDSYALSDEAKEKLKDLFEKYTTGKNVRVTLEGHTDAIGTYEYNDKLSVRRAKAAEEFMINEGLAKERVVSEGKGELEPVAPNDTPEGRRQNRRVKIVVVK